MDFSGGFDVPRDELPWGYNSLTSGTLDEFDALDDYRMDFVEWLGLYEIWISLNTKYQQMITRQSVVIQIKSNLELAYG